LSQSRREGSAPPRSLTRIETAESARLRKKIEKKYTKSPLINEADRRNVDKMPKHLFSGKRGIGKTDRR
jgi:nucleolar GTP-binding protein